MEQLGFHWPSLAVYLVNFSILLVVLYAVGYKPILRILDQRAERIRNSLEEAERVKSESEERQEEMRRELEQARQEGQALISQARDLATKFKEEEREKAAGEAEAFLAKARGDIERERDNAMEELRGQFAGLAITAAEKVIERSLDEKAHREIIERVLDETSQVRGEK
ncbi:MAG: ATP synthase F0 subunit B [SAR202 cluster bacterium Io17-Chloro-G3]|nr:MAG: ATP synthase F0 subunit B [SAR202 cluster bacterium Io17-Chloro-G3]